VSTIDHKIIFLLLALLSTRTLLAQATTGTILGVVSDTSGAVVPGVSVTITNVDTGFERIAVADEAGRYNAPSLPLGEYQVNAKKEGFQTEIRKGITLTVGREAVVNLALRVGEARQQVVVSGDAALVDTTDATLGSLVDNEQIRDLPLNGRGFEQLALFQPGVLATGVSSFSPLQGGGQQKVIDGGRPEQNLFLLDGTDINDMFGKGTGDAAGVTLGVDAIQEYKVLTNGYSAEYGRAAAGVIVAVTKSGTNQFHGTAFEFLRNSDLDSRNFFDGKAPPAFKRNQFGGTVGGPIKKDKLFFLGSFEALRQRLGTTVIDTVPDALAHQGMIPVGGKLTNIGISPVTAPYMALLPLPNGRDNGDGTGQLSQVVNTPTNANYGQGRVDWNISSSDSIFVRYTIDKSDVITPNAILPQGIYDIVNGAREFTTLSETKILTPNLINKFTFAFNRSHIFESYQSPGVPANLHLLPGQNTFGTLTLSAGLSPEFGNSETGPRDLAQNLYEYSDSINWNRGKHSIKIGAEIKRIQFNPEILSRFYGRLTYASLQSFLTNVPLRFEYIYQNDFASRRGYRQFLYGFYAQDDYKFSSRLTINIGLRYEPATVPTEVAGRISNIRNFLTDNSATVGGSWFQNPSWTNFGPRVGFAWDIFGNSKTVFRSGFGMYYDQISPTQLVGDCCTTPPFNVRVQTSNPSYPVSPNILFTPPPAAQVTCSCVPYYMQQPYVFQYNGSIERQLPGQTIMSIGFAGSKGVHLPRIADLNVPYPQILPNGQPYYPAGAPLRNPNFGFYSPRLTDSPSLYNALLVSVKKRFTTGFQFQVSYTFQKAMDIGSGTIGGSDVINGTTSSLDPYDWKRDWAPSNFNITHNLVVNGSYELPFFKSFKGIQRLLLYGWQVNGVGRVASGQPQTVSLAFNQSQDQDATIGVSQKDRPNLAAGANANPLSGNIGQYWSPASFALEPAGTYGNIGRNTLWGPGLANLDFSLMKIFHVTEKQGLQFRAEFFNILNHPNFLVPSGVAYNTATALNPNFGRVTATLGSSRQIQFALKYNF
jgi:hypothetical protein